MRPREFPITQPHFIADLLEAMPPHPEARVEKPCHWTAQFCTFLQGWSQLLIGNERASCGMLKGSVLSTPLQYLQEIAR